MAVFDTLYLLFKSNAKDVKKDTEEAGKATDDFERKLSEADKAASGIALSLLEIGTTAFAAFTTFEGLKNGISHAIDMNAQLERTQILTGENAVKLDAWDAALAQSTGNRGEFLNWFTQYAALLQATGRGDQIGNVIPNFKKQADYIKSASDADAHLRFQQLAAQYGLPQDFYISMRTQGGEGLDEAASKLQDLKRQSESGNQAALDFKKTEQETAAIVEGAFSNLATEVLPILTGVLDLFNKAAEKLIGISKEWTTPNILKKLGFDITDHGSGGASSDTTIPAFSASELFKPVPKGGKIPPPPMFPMDDGIMITAAESVREADTSPANALRNVSHNLSHSLHIDKIEIVGGNGNAQDVAKQVVDQIESYMQREYDKAIHNFDDIMKK